MNGRIALLLVFNLFFQFTFAAIPMPHVPDEKETPGDICDRRDSDFIGYRYSQKVAFCRRNVSKETKASIYDQYSVPAKQRVNYTIDHFIPLSIGGSNHPENLWPEHKKIKQLRYNLETEIFEAVRDGRMTQEEAIQKIIKAKMNPPLLKDNNL